MGKPNNGQNNIYIYRLVIWALRWMLHVGSGLLRSIFRFFFGIYIPFRLRILILHFFYFFCSPRAGHRTFHSTCCPRWILRRGCRGHGPAVGLQPPLLTSIQKKIIVHTFFRSPCTRNRGYKYVCAIVVLLSPLILFVSVQCLFRLDSHSCC